VTDRPRLIGWSSLDLAHRQPLTPLVIVRAPPAGSSSGGKLANRSPCDERRADHPHNRDRRRGTPCGAPRHRSERLPPRPPTKLPWPRTAIAPLGGAPRLAHRFHREAPAACASTRCGMLLDQRLALGLPCGSPTPERSMRWTDFCHLTSSYEYPRIVGSPRVERLRASAMEESPVSRQCEALRRTARGLLDLITSAGCWSRRRACTPDL
jgi:hypothetical protein